MGCGVRRGVFAVVWMDGPSKKQTSEVLFTGRKKKPQGSIQKFSCTVFQGNHSELLDICIQFDPSSIWVGGCFQR